MSRTPGPPRVSVVVAAYDAARTIGHTVASVQLQTVRELEVLVVDDGSRDGTANVVESLAREDARIRLLRQENAGPAAARNAGIRAAGAPFVAILDADDLWLPDYVERMLGALEESPWAGFAFTDAWSFDDASWRVRSVTSMGLPLEPAVLPRDPAALLLALLELNLVYTSVTVRREVLERVGGYDERLKGVEDYELWLRLAAAGVAGVRVPRLLGLHRLHAASISHDGRQLLGGLVRTYRLVQDEYDVPPEAAALAAAQERRYERELRRLERLQRAGAAGRALRRAAAGARGVVRARRDWLPETPVEVVETLERAGVRRGS